MLFIALTFALIVIRLILIEYYIWIIKRLQIYSDLDKYTYVYFHPSSSLYQNKFFNIRKERWLLTKRLFRYNLGHFLSAMLTLNTITKTSIDQLRETSMYLI